MMRAAILLLRLRARRLLNLMSGRRKKGAPRRGTGPAQDRSWAALAMMKSARTEDGRRRVAWALSSAHQSAPDGVGGQAIMTRLAEECGEPCLERLWRDAFELHALGAGLCA